MSSRGKDICNQLKAVRRSIAEENGIPLDMPECPHTGPCPGTCPQCEKELRQLEGALASRLSMGKVATVAGLALALSAPAAVQAQQPVQQQKASTVRQAKLLPVRGTVVDSKTKEPLPFCNVSFTPVGATERVAEPKFATTDFDGLFKLELPEGNYTIRVLFVGYKPYEAPVTVSPNADTIGITLDMTATVLGMPEVITVGSLSPTIEIGPDAATQQMEIEGVKVRVQ